INSLLSGNSAGSEGGGIWNDSPTLTVRSCTFTANSAGSEGGGIMFAPWGSRSATILGSMFTDNSAGVLDRGDGWGGGICNNGTMRVRGCTFAGNSAPRASGGGIAAMNGSLDVVESTFLRNWATSSGGGVYHQHGGLALTNCTLAENSAS